MRPQNSATARLNRAWYLGTFVLCLLAGATSVVWLAFATRNQPAPDATLSVPIDQLAIGVIGLVLWLAVLAALAWWALRSYQRLAGSAVSAHDGER